MVRSRRRKGVALLMALMFAMLMGVVARGIFRLTLGASSQQALHQERARQASLSGLEYARSQLALDSDWKGSSASQTTISMDDLVVKEVNGNVFGLLTFPDGARAHFRIRFNHQNDASGNSQDGLPDPPADCRVASQTLSINNLNSNAPANVPGQDSNFAVDPSSPAIGTVPSHSVLLEVEGRAGRGIDQMSAATMTLEPSGFVDSVSAQSILKVELDEPTTPAVLQSAGAMELITVEGVNIDSFDESNPSIRSKQEITVRTPDNNPGQLTMPDGNVYCANQNLQASYDPNSITVYNEDPKTNLSSLTWDQVSRPGPTSVKLPAGTYVLWPAMASVDPVTQKVVISPSEFHYHAMDYQVYRDTVYTPYIAQGQLPPTQLQGMVLSPTNPQIRGNQALLEFTKAVTIRDDQVHIKRDLLVHPEVPSGDPSGLPAKDFAVVPFFDAAMKSADVAGLPVPADFPSNFKPTGPANLQLTIDNARVYSQGNMILKGSTVQAFGATLIGEGSLQLNAPALAVKPGESNLSLYFKGDINLSSFDNQNFVYGDFKLNGIVYSWGNVKIDMGDPDGSFDLQNWGNLDFIGSLVAYGGDPVSGLPGLNSQGHIGIRSRAANIHHDPTTVAQLANTEELSQALVISSVGSWLRL